MSSSLKGMISGLVATLVLSGLLLLKSTMNLVPELSIIQLLVNLGSIGVGSAWVDHFIVGVIIWGLLFAAYESVAEQPASYPLKGIIFGILAWLIMMVTFMPLTKGGFFGAKLGPMAAFVTLFYHVIYGVVLGTTYGLLTAWVPVKEAEGTHPTST